MWRAAGNPMKILLIYNLIHATGDTDNFSYKWNGKEEIFALSQQKMMLIKAEIYLWHSTMANWFGMYLF